MFYESLTDYQSSIYVENKLNEFLETLDCDQIKDIKISSSQASNYVTYVTILVTYTEEE